MENIIFSVIYGTIVLGMIMMIEAAEGKLIGRSLIRKVFALSGLLILTLTFSFMLAIFKWKGGEHYPYSMDNWLDWVGLEKIARWFIYRG